MQITLTELIGFFGIIVSIITGVWLIVDRFGRLEGRVGILEEKMDEILVYIRHKAKKHAHRKH